MPSMTAEDQEISSTRFGFAVKEQEEIHHRRVRNPNFSTDSRTSRPEFNTKHNNTCSKDKTLGGLGSLPNCANLIKTNSSLGYNVKC